VNATEDPDEDQFKVTRPFPPMAVSPDGIPGAVVGVNVPPPPLMPQAGSSSARRTALQTRTPTQRISLSCSRRPES
jgi:hypothetical protein